MAKKLEYLSLMNCFVSNFYPQRMLSLLFACVLCGCSGEQMQDVYVSTDVPNTRIYVNGVEQGTTPNYVTLDKKQQYNLELKTTGYYPYTKRISVSQGNKFEPISVRMPRNREEFLAMTSPPLPVRNQTIDTPSSQVPPSQESQSSNFWGELAGLVAGAVVNAAINEYTGGSGTANTPDTTALTAGTGKKRRKNVTYWEPCSYCYGGAIKTGFSTGVCPKCLGKGKYKRVDWTAM